MRLAKRNKKDAPGGRSRQAPTSNIEKGLTTSVALATSSVLEKPPTSSADLQPDSDSQNSKLKKCLIYFLEEDATEGCAIARHPLCYLLLL